MALTRCNSGKNLVDYALHVRLFRQHISGHHWHRLLVQGMFLITHTLMSGGNVAIEAEPLFLIDDVPGRPNGPPSTLGYRRPRTIPLLDPLLHP